MLLAHWESYNKYCILKASWIVYYVFREARKEILIKTGPISYVSNITNLSVEEKMILYHTANLKTPLQHCLPHTPAPSYPDTAKP